ncbi:unnamed protein product [Rotaria sordida]|uniref:Major facilitator superfamily (MFS) profile domain-containing protein n=1 Tax=Rotaria sordida TaxID=392033 RepID=A0A814RXP2_9BILA|nr:unnamed protein product [Rotaria sordida]
MFPPIMVYTWSFTAATPSFRCRTPMDDISDVSITDKILQNYKPSKSQCDQYQKQISLSECQRCFQLTNETYYSDTHMKPCTNFIFDRTYYQSTLVEEVYILPESPRWLISKGHYNHAERVLRRIAKTNGSFFDSMAYDDLINEEKKREALYPKKSHGLRSLFQSKIMIIIAINMSFQWFVQNLVFYGVSQNTGAWLTDPYIAFLAGALVEIVAYFIVHLVLNRWGRKLAYCTFVLLFGFFSFFVVPIQMFTLKNSQEQYILMFIINVLLKFLASGSYAIIYIYANELFPTQGRNTGIGLCSMVARFGAIIGTLSNDLLARVWIHFPIVVFGTTSLIAVVFATICPETMNKPLPETIHDVDRMGLTWPCWKPKTLICEDMNGMADSDEHVSLKNQLKENDSF